MRCLKISYGDELFSGYDYMEYPNDFTIDCGLQIVVTSNSLLKMATVLEENEVDPDLVRATFVRVATDKDKEQYGKNMAESSSILSFAHSKALELNLEMRFISSFYTLDRKQLFISYVADNRVDFRELAKALAQKYKTRIELRQIGVRDRAKKIGGLGPCGLFLCCHTFLTEFNSVSINMAKNQFLALNPSKINGICGRLLCCLGYENDLYTELKKGYPKVGSVIDTPNGSGKVTSIDIFKGIIHVDLKEKGNLEIKKEDYCGSIE